jgi:hypothetical protein
MVTHVPSLHGTLHQRRFCEHVEELGGDDERQKAQSPQPHHLEEKQKE